MPSGLESICLKCLEKAPARRFASAQDLADDLGRWLNDERPRATPGLLTRARRGARRNRVAVNVGAGLVAAGLVLASLDGRPYFKSSEYALKRTERELSVGRPVTLIGKTGGPAWSRWVAGKSKAVRTSPRITCSASARTD